MKTTIPAYQMMLYHIVVEAFKHYFKSHENVTLTEASITEEEILRGAPVCPIMFTGTVSCADKACYFELDYLYINRDRAEVVEHDGEPVIFRVGTEKFVVSLKKGATIFGYPDVAELTPITE